jgi:hypothetical protein
MQYLWHLCLHEPQILTSKPVTQRFVSISVTGLFVRLMERGVRKGFSDKERNVAGREYALSKTGPTPTSGRTDTNFYGIWNRSGARDLSSQAQAR